LVLRYFFEVAKIGKRDGTQIKQIGQIYADFWLTTIDTIDTIGKCEKDVIRIMKIGLIYADFIFKNMT